MTSDTTLEADLVPPEKLPYMRGLDGLRAIAVMAVLFYHADFTWARGGFLGVEVFFVISGYLITSLLLVEWLRTGTVGLKTFWLRRARRLLPAVFLLLGAVSLMSIFIYRDVVHRMLGDVVAALGYFTNWFLIVENVSYFETFGRPPLLQHLWSLSIEEQFYVLWPLVFSFGMALFKAKKRETTIRSFLGLTVVGIVASTAMMAMLYTPYDDPSRVYYGTDTRAAGILVGVALSLVWIPWRLNKDLSSKKVSLLNAGGWASLLALGWILVATDEFSPLLYRGGFLVTSLVTAAVIAITVHPAARLGAVLEIAPLKWIGLRSYGIYLWHWPIFMVTRPGFDISGNPYLLFTLRTALTFGVAEVSYRFVEEPIRRLGFRTWMGQIRGVFGVSNLRGASIMGSAILATIAIVVGGLVLGAARPPAVTIASQAVSDGEPIPELTADVVAPPTTSAGPAEAAGDEAVAKAGPVDTGATEEGVQAAPTSSVPVASGESASTTSTPEDSIEEPVAQASPVTVSIIGDSVVAGAAAPLEAVFGSTLVLDATVSRQFKHADDVAAQMRADNLLGDVVIVHLGTNGAFSNETFDEVVSGLSDAQKLIIVNAKVPRRWEGSVNSAIAAGQERWPHVTVIDWHTIAGEHPEWFNEDRVHLNRTGQHEYAKLLYAAVNG